VVLLLHEQPHSAWPETMPESEQEQFVPLEPSAAPVLYWFMVLHMLWLHEHVQLVGPEALPAASQVQALPQNSACTVAHAEAFDSYEQLFTGAFLGAK